MATVNKTLVVPAGIQPQMSKIDQSTGDAEGYTPASFGTNALLELGGLTKPIKNTQTQVTTPYALNDLIAARDSLGLSTKELNDALKAREGTGYSLANALAGIPQQQGYGTWLTDFARAFGKSMAAPIDAYADRAEQKYKADLQDIVNRLAFDKAMGGTVKTDIGYMYPESNNNELALAMMLLGNQ